MVTYNREYLFGEITNGKMALNDIGRIIKNEWLNTPRIRLYVPLDEFIVMPNHLHGIVIITNEIEKYVAEIVETNRYSSLQYKTPFKSPSHTIGAIIRGFKSTTTKQIDCARGTPGAPVWQRNYYEHLIRNENELNEIREYIINNPIKWELDWYNETHHPVSQ